MVLRGEGAGRATGATAGPAPGSRGDAVACLSPLTGAIEVLGEGEAQAEDDGLRPQHLPRRRHLLLPRQSRSPAQPAGTPSRGGKFGDPRGMHVPVPGAGGGTPVTHIEEADVHVEVDVHVVDGPVLPAKTHGTVPGGQGEAGAARGRGGHPRRGGGGHARLPGHQTWAPPRPGRHRERAWVPQGRHGPVLRGRRSRVPGGTVWGCGGPSARPPDGHGILAVDLPHGVDVGVQLRVPVQVGGAGPLRHGAVAPSDLELPRRAAPHSGAGAGRGLPSPLPRGTHRTRRPQRSPGRRRGTPRTRCPRRSHRPSNTGP